MYNVLDICRYIINYSDDKGYGISNLKLQKVLYFIQAYFVSYTEKKEPCFDAKIEAWEFGPVVPAAYHEYKQYGSNDIPRIDMVLQINFDNILKSRMVPFDDSIISNADKEIIDGLIEKFADYSATTLVSITHNQSPWINAYNKGKNSIISIESIREYYNGK